MPQKRKKSKEGSTLPASGEVLTGSSAMSPVDPAKILAEVLEDSENAARSSGFPAAHSPSPSHPINHMTDACLASAAPPHVLHTGCTLVAPDPSVPNAHPHPVISHSVDRAVEPKPSTTSKAVQSAASLPPSPHAAAELYVPPVSSPLPTHSPVMTTPPATSADAALSQPMSNAPTLLPPQKAFPNSERIQVAASRDSFPPAPSPAPSKMEPLVLTPSAVPTTDYGTTRVATQPPRSLKIADVSCMPLSPEVIPTPVIQYSADDAIAALEAAIRATEDESETKMRAEQSAELAYANAKELVATFGLPLVESGDELAQDVLEERRPWAPGDFMLDPDRLSITLHDNERIEVFPDGVSQLCQRFPNMDVRCVGRGERIGEGTFAGIYRATLGELAYAVKSIHSIEASEMHLRNAQRCIKNEIYYALHCSAHPNVVPSYQVWWEGGGLHILMDHVDLSLGFVTSRLGPLKEHILSHISLQMLHGLRALRQHGIVHQDINAENILIGFNGVVRLCDFGMIQVYPDWNKPGGPTTLTLPVPGSSNYKKWDTCSMGLMLVQCAAGIQRHLVMSLLDQEGGASFDPIVERHFKGKGLKPPSDELKDFVSQCVAMASCDELLQHSFITGHSTSVHSTSAALESWLSKHKVVLAPAGAPHRPVSREGVPPHASRGRPPDQHYVCPPPSPYPPTGHAYNASPPAYAPPYAITSAPAVSSANTTVAALPPGIPPGLYPPPGTRMIPVGGVASARANAGYAAPRVAPVLPPSGSPASYGGYESYARASAILPTPMPLVPAAPMQPMAAPRPTSLPLPLPIPPPQKHGPPPAALQTPPPLSPPAIISPKTAFAPSPTDSSRSSTPPLAKEKAGKIVCRRCGGPHFSKDCREGATAAPEAPAPAPSKPASAGPPPRMPPSRFAGPPPGHFNPPQPHATTLQSYPRARPAAVPPNRPPHMQPPFAQPKS